MLIVRRSKIVLYSLWYHHTETSELSKITKITKITKIYKYEHIVVKFTHKFYYYVLIFIYFSNFLKLQFFSNFSVMIPEVI